MIRWTPDLEDVTGLGQAWAWPVRLDGPEAARALAGSPARPCDLADAALLRQPGAGARRLLRRRLLRALVARAQDRRVEDVDISRSAEGAPRAQGAYVSIAARGDWALLAVGPAPLGVDLEIAGEDPPPDVTGALGAPWSAWTAREAYAKAAGVSLDEALGAQVAEVTADRVQLRVGARRIFVARFERGEVVCAAVALPI
jgi:phosphopantetheinyl transferase